MCPDSTAMQLSDDTPILSRFVGRAEEMESIHTALSQMKRPVMLLGPRGIGKTTLAKCYEHRYRDFYTKTAFLSLSALNGPAAFLPLLARSLSLSATDPRRLIKSMRSEAALIILDDLSEIPQEVLSHVLSSLLPLLNGRNENRFLFTSSNYPGFLSTWDDRIRHLDPVVLRLSGLSSAAFADLLGMLGIIVPTQAALEIHARTNGNPQALHLFASLIAQGKHNSKHALAKLQEAYSGEWGSSLSNLVIVSTEAGLRTVPVARDPSSGIITPTSEIFVGSPYVCIRAHAHFWREKLEEFDALLNDPSTKEKHFQDFFERNPRLLLGLDYRKLIPHPVLLREQEGPLIPDFFLQPLDGVLCDILDSQASHSLR